MCDTGVKMQYERNVFTLQGRRSLILICFAILILFGFLFSIDDGHRIAIYAQRWRMFGLTSKEGMDLYSAAFFFLSIFPLILVVIPEKICAKIWFRTGSIDIVPARFSGDASEVIDFSSIESIRFFRQRYFKKIPQWFPFFENSICIKTQRKDFIFRRIEFQSEENFRVFERQLRRHCPKAIVLDE
jgi:hypothetical protein